MTNPTLEERVALLEARVEQLRTELDKANHVKDWRNTIGMFAGDETMERIREAGRKIREADRRRAKKALQTKSHRTKK